MTATSVRTATILATSALVLAAAAPVYAAEDGARQLVAKALASLPAVPFAAKLQLSNSNGEVHILSLSTKPMKGARASYLEIEPPDDLQGTRFLFIEKPGGLTEQYIKVPASRKPLVVLAAIRTEPFLNSTFYVSDMVEPPIDEFTYSFAGEAKVLGRTCKLVEAVPKNLSDAVYGKTVLAIDPQALLVLRRQFFDHQNKPLKVWTVEKLEKVDGFPTLREQKMVNLQDQTHSELKITQIKYNVSLPDTMFASSYLTR